MILYKISKIIYHTNIYYNSCYKTMIISTIFQYYLLIQSIWLNCFDHLKTASLLDGRDNVAYY